MPLLIISSIFFLSTNNDKLYRWLNKSFPIIFDDISIGDNIEKAFQKYGEKKEAYKDDYYTRYDYKITDDKYIYYLVTDDNLIAEISIWWR